MKIKQTLKHVIITQEFPMLNKEEIYFFFVEGKLHKFSTYESAVKWCKDNDYTYNLARSET